MLLLKKQHATEGQLKTDNLKGQSKYGRFDLGLELLYFFLNPSFTIFMESNFIVRMFFFYF